MFFAIGEWLSGAGWPLLDLESWLIDERYQADEPGNLVIICGARLFLWRDSWYKRR